MRQADSRMPWQTLAEAGDLAGAIEAYVREKDHVTFAELKSRLGKHFDLVGQHAVVGCTDPNFVIWAGMSDTYSQAVIGLLRDGRVRMEPCRVLIYMIDGMVSGLPVAKRPPKAGYKEPHWAPVCLRPPTEGKAVVLADLVKP